MTENNADTKAHTPPQDTDPAHEAETRLVMTDQQLQQLLRSKSFQGNVLAGVVASAVFFALTELSKYLFTIGVHVVSGLTAAGIGLIVAFLLLIAVNTYWTFRHTLDPKAMGNRAFFILQAILGIVGIGMIFALLTVTS